MLSALTYFGVSVAVLGGLLFFYSAEDRVGRRVLFARLRQSLDTLFVRLWQGLCWLGRMFAESFIRLLWLYGLHRLLKRALHLARTFEHKVETMLRQNKLAARELRQNRERNHLDEIADHKESSALTDRQKEKLREH